ncbi:SCA7-domain-containing protein [Rhizophagus clarus]|uniref:SCA7-domain-containing protein n=1 Tax=Rhizophagus clarus TaxID=94130 RepID=A0A8H3L281_9GLOM|nr:SCA7-domain-containing protein [Rhizophagus clarus]
MPCTRSLTCKSHSIQMKRSVTGRLRSYDILLSQYQKKFIVRSKGDKNNLSNNNNEKQDDVEKEDVKQNISSSTPTPIVSSREIVMILLKNKLFYFS